MVINGCCIMRNFKSIRPNYFSILWRISILIGYLFLLYDLYTGSFRKNWEAKSVIEYYLVIAIFCLPILLLLRTLAGVTIIRYSETEKTFQLTRLLIFHKTYSINNLEGFRRSTLINNIYGTMRHRWILKFKTGRSCKLSELNLRKLDDFKAFLLRSGVPSLGFNYSPYSNSL